MTLADPAEWRDIFTTFAGFPRLTEDEEFRNGFTQMLTYVLGCGIDDSIPNSGWLECLARHPSEQAEAEWDKGGAS